MNPAEFAYGVVLVLLLTGLASYFGWRQLRMLRSLRLGGEDGAEDVRYLRRQAWRRLTCCGLMLLFAAMLVGWFWLERDFRQVTQEFHERSGGGQGVTLQPGDGDFVKGLAVYWIVALLVLLTFVVLAVLDMWSITRFGVRQLRRLRDDHQTMLEHQIARRRGERNGHG